MSLRRRLAPWTLACAVGLGATGCATTPAIAPVATLTVPAPQARATRPVIFLRVSAARRDGDFDREREQDVAFSREVRSALMAMALSQQFFGDVVTDPLEVATVDYHVTVTLDEVRFDGKGAESWPGIAEVYAQGDNFLLPDLDSHNKALRARITILDRQRHPVGLSAQSSPTARSASSQPGATTMNWQYQGALQFTTARLLGLLGTSAVFRAPVKLKTVTTTPVPTRVSGSGPRGHGAASP